MSILILLLGISLCIAVFFLIAFIWSVRGGQYDDQVTPALRMLNDDETPRTKRNNPPTSEKEPTA